MHLNLGFAVMASFCEYCDEILLWLKITDDMALA
jgi:hypothetical protein